MKIALIGSNGQLGSDLCSVISGGELFKLTHRDIEVCDFNNIKAVLGQIKPDVIINTTAYHRVDDCEDNPELAFEVNAFAVKNLAIVANGLSAKLVHITTDYVFDGLKNAQYIEEDLPNPMSVYGLSKYAGEVFLRNYCNNWILVRTTGLYGIAGSSGKGGNFVETMIKLAKEDKKIRVVNDQIMSPTFTLDLAAKLYEVIKKDARGIFHITNSGYCSWFEFAGEIFKLTGLNSDFGPTTTKEFAAKARRPQFSSLANKGLELLDIKPVRDWKDALKDYLKRKGHI
ncbi:MAG: dTDP-4-dehydrorhamnose reductase [Planctomycetes bacterium]|nr:dTDP-4-dehydrorhamnose reductase [Planctomycetota bacterium]